MGTLKFLFFNLFIFMLSGAGQPVFSQTVFITKTGEKYHKDGCRHLSRSSFALTLSEAKEKGYTACKVCKPGSYGSTALPKSSAGSKTPAASGQCMAKTKAGKRCSRTAKDSGGKCWQHSG